MESKQKFTHKEGETIVEIQTQTLDEPNFWVVLVHKKTINLKNGKTKTEQISRIEIDKK